MEGDEAISDELTISEELAISEDDDEALSEELAARVAGGPGLRTAAELRHEARRARALHDEGTPAEALHSFSEELLRRQVDPMPQDDMSVT